MTGNKILAHSLTSKERTKDVLLTENVSFSSLILPIELLKGLSDAGFAKPSPIQVKALPIGRCGFDLIVKSKSGTGKTLVFGIISLESIKIEKYQPQVLILAPTREIAVQIQDVIKNIGKYYKDLSVECFIGGLSVTTDRAKCKSCHIAVGTPGRLKQLIQENCLSTDSVRLFVLDEADKLIEDSYQNDINTIYNRLPGNKQIIMCSATYPDEMQTYLSQYLRNPVVVTVELETPLLLGLKQFVRVIDFKSQNSVLQCKIKNEELLKILPLVPFVQCLVFSNYQTRAESICNYLNQNGWSAIYLSAAQTQSERLKSLTSLKDYKSRILVTTDLAARGIDAQNVDLVINYDIPNDATTYLHRMGRAGRYGSTGSCINLSLEGQETRILQNILFLIGGQNLSIPIVDEDYSLDRKDNLLFGEIAEDLVKNFDEYKDTIFKIRGSLAKNNKKSAKNKKSPKGKHPTKEKNDVIEEKLQEDALTVLEQLGEGTFNSITSHKDDVILDNVDLSDMLEQLAENGELEDDTNNKKVDTSCKNKALFSVAKILCNSEISNEECKDLSTYFSTLNSIEKIENPALDEKKETKILFNSTEFLENIFSLSYMSQISNDNEIWQNCLPEEEKWKLEEQCYDDEFVDEEEQGSDQDYDFELEKDVEVKYTDNVNDINIMEWIPVEPGPATSSKVNKSSLDSKLLLSNMNIAKTDIKKSNHNDEYHEEYETYYQHCSKNLWQNGLSFRTVKKFDEWYLYDWERQLNAVRDFVQKKIYLNEMSQDRY